MTKRNAVKWVLVLVGALLLAMVLLLLPGEGGGRHASPHSQAPAPRPPNKPGIDKRAAEENAREGRDPTSPFPPPIAKGPDRVPPGGCRVLVEVVDAGGAPVEGAHVALFFPWSTVINPGGPLPEPRVRAATDAKGIADLEAAGLPAGTEVRLEATHAESAAGASARLGSDPGRSVRLVLQPSVPIAGRVDLRDGPSLAGASVVAEFVTDGGTGLAFARTGPGGGFSLKGVPRDAFRLEVSIEVLRGPGHWGRKVILPRGDPPSSEVNIVVEPTCRIRGRCVDARGDPMGDVFVSVGVGLGHAAGEGRTDAAGAFDFESPRGSWSLIATSDRTEPFVRRDVACVGANLDVGVLTLEADRKCIVRGRCLGADGAAMADAEVSAGVGPGHSVGHSKTDENGEFEMQVRRGTWAVIVNGKVWWRDIDCEGANVNVGTSGPPGLGR